jgi:sugar phosphate isomerase/epimerase
MGSLGVFSESAVIMKLTLYGSIGWRHPLGIGQVARWAAAYGWDAIDARGMSIDIAGPLDVRLNAFGYDMLGPRQIRDSARRELRGMFDKEGIPLLGIYCSSPVNLAGEQGDACRQLCREYFRLGADLGVEWIRPINNIAARADDLHSQDEVYERTVEGLRNVGQLAAELEIGILLKNNENTVTPDAPSLLNLKQELSSMCRVGIGTCRECLLLCLRSVYNAGSER